MKKIAELKRTQQAFIENFDRDKFTVAIIVAVDDGVVYEARSHFLVAKVRYDKLHCRAKSRKFAILLRSHDFFLEEIGSEKMYELICKTNKGLHFGQVMMTLRSYRPRLHLTFKKMIFFPY